MATIFTHPIVAVALGKLARVERRAIVAGAVLSIIPDLDFIAYRTRLGDWHWLGHRGFTHSLAFALVMALCTAAYLVGRAGREGAGRVPPPYSGRRWWKLTAFLFACGASHGLLDALTHGGAGIMFFWPFSLERHSFPWSPLLVSSIGPRFFSAYGLEVLVSELKWVWFPCALALGTDALLRKIARR